MFGLVVCLLAVAAVLFTCVKIPDYCGAGALYDPEFQFCFAGKAHNLCGGEKFNPLTDVCENHIIGTMCADESFARRGTPCGGYALTTASIPEDGGIITRIPEDTVNYAAGDQVVLSAAAANGYRFAGWAGASESASAIVTLTMDSNKPMVAVFDPVSTPGASEYRLITTAFPARGGSITPSTANHPAGTPVTATATAAEGYRFTGWSGASTSTSPTVTVTVDASKTLVAMFTPIAYTLRIGANPEASGIVFVNGTAIQGSVSIDAGTEAVVLARPMEGFIFTGWSGATGATDNPVRITMTSNNMTITALFTRIEGIVNLCDIAPQTTPGCPGHNPCLGMIAAIPGSSCCEAHPLFNGCCSGSGDISICTEWNNWVITSAATCTTTGTQTRTCAAGSTETQTGTIAQLTGEQCDSECNEWGDWEVMVAATCTTSGTQTRTCVSGSTETQTGTIAQLTGAQCGSECNEWGDWEVTVAATCTTSGTQMRNCVSGSTETQTETIAQLTGTECTPAGCTEWGSWQTTVLPNCERAGLETRACVVGSAADSTRTVPQLTGAECNPLGCTEWGTWHTTTQPSCEQAGVERRACVVGSAADSTRAVPQLTGADCVTTYTITYSVNGGSGTAPTAQTVNAGNSVTLADGSGLTRNEFTFGGWNTASGGTGTGYAAGATLAPTGNITLYAVWNPVVIDPCAGLPSATPGSACCQSNPNFTGCQSTGTGLFCIWRNDPSTCEEIGTSNTPSGPACNIMGGDVVTSCPPNLCAGLPSATPGSACCQQSPTYPGCQVGTGQYCYWLPSICVEIGSAGCDESCATAAGCTSNYGLLSTRSDCSDIIAPQQDWCYWSSDGCVPISNPNAMSQHNPGMTNREECVNLGNYFTSEAACRSFVPPLITYYCDWSDEEQPNNCWNIGNGTRPCSGFMSSAPCIDDCRETGGTVVRCTGFDSPVLGICCEGIRE